MKKKILFVCYGLGIGGIEKCLVNLVNKLDKDYYDITIATMNPEYDLLGIVNSCVKIIPFEDQFVNTTDTMKVIAQKHSIKDKIMLLLQYVLYRLAVKFQLKHWYLQRKINDKFDCAIAYTHTGFVPNYVIDKVDARVKVLWYHTLWGEKSNLECYEKFDWIVAVSKACKKNFIQMYPSLEDKVSVLYNFYDFTEIVSKAKETPDCPLSSNKKIVTVARLSPEKGYQIAIKACAKLKELLNYDFVWYWVGDGPDKYRTHAEKLIKELQVDTCFCLLGKQMNPYSYINNCDIYVQTSEREAFCTAIIEAITLKKPIVSTDNSSIHEQVSDGINAYVVGHEPDKVANRIFELMNNKELRESFSQKSLLDKDFNYKQLKEYALFFENILK